MITKLHFTSYLVRFQHQNMRLRVPFPLATVGAEAKGDFLAPCPRPRFARFPLLSGDLVAAGEGGEVESFGGVDSLGLD